MGTEAYINGIYIATKAGERMQRLPRVQAIKDQGLQGDRYANGMGFYQTVEKSRPAIRHVSLMLLDDLKEGNLIHGTNFAPEETRRGLLLEGKLDLPNILALIGVEFAFGDVRMLGMEECTPCLRPSLLANKKKQNFMQAFRENGRGGLRAAVLNSGTISEGARLRIIS